MGNHNLAAKSIFVTSQNGGLGDVRGMCGGITWWCQDGVWRGVWSEIVWQRSGGRPVGD